AGTVSGAPKPRAMEILHDLEGTARGPYAGVVGYLSLNGNVDTAIAIRTLFADGPMYYLQAGAGIVADSDPAREWFETEPKLEGVRAALREAGAWRSSSTTTTTHSCTICTKRSGKSARIRSSIATTELH